MKKQIVDGENWYLVGKGDSATLARRLTSLLSDEPLNRRLSANARKYYERNLNMETRAKELYAAFEQLTESDHG